MKQPVEKLPRYVWRRPKSRFLWFRMAVPKEFQELAGCKIIQSSLETTDKKEAGILAGRKRAELFELWGAVARRVPTLAELEDAAVAIGHDMTLDYEDARRNGMRGADRDSWRNFARGRQINLDEQRTHTAIGETALVRGLANAAIDDLGFDLEPGSELYARFCDLLNKARLSAVNVAAKRVAGDVEAETDSKLVQGVRARQAATAKPGETLLELFERMVSEELAKDALRPDTARQNRKVIQLFADFVGKDRAVDTITPIEVAEFRDARRDVPPKWSMKREYRELSLREAAAKARRLNDPKTSFVTVNRELSTISPLYAWLARQPRWAGLRNPCDGLHYQDVKGKNPRPPYETATLNKILQSPLFTGFMGEGKEHEAGNQHADDWRKWIPLIAMFTGARAGEIAQLRIGDVRKEYETSFVHMVEDAKSGLKVKNRKRRVTPVHSKLEALGFGAFVERRRKADGDDAALFPELVANNRDQIGAEPSAWWRDYLARIGVKDASANGGDGFGLHSFRHELADRLRTEAELLDNEVAIWTP